MRFLLSVSLVFATAGVVSGANAQDANSCQPQPECAILYSPQTPGAPTPGLRQNYNESQEYIQQDIRKGEPLDFGKLHLPDRPHSTVVVCHGEMMDQCREHPFDEFEDCSVGPANPQASGERICRGQRFGFRVMESPRGGNRCGYSWYAIDCY